MAETTILSKVHPAPERNRAGLATLFFGLLAGPIAWAARLLFNYGIATHSCFPGSTPMIGAARQWVRITFISIDAAAIVIAGSAALVSYRAWNRKRRTVSGDIEAPEQAWELIQIGEGRTRFLAIWGMMTGVGFALALVFDLMSPWVVPLCGW
jgi:hypothetical protein